jgi:hypothetical protein
MSKKSKKITSDHNALILKMQNSKVLLKNFSIFQNLFREFSVVYLWRKKLQKTGLKSL